MKPILIIIFVLIRCFSFGQNSVPPQKVIGKYVPENWEFYRCTIKIKRKGRFKEKCEHFEHRKTDFKRKGTWTINSDTLLLTYKRNKYKFYKGSNKTQYLITDSSLIHIIPDYNTGKNFIYKRVSKS